MGKVSVGIVNRSRFARGAIVAYLSNDPGLSVIAPTDSVLALLRDFGEKRIDVIVVELSDIDDGRWIEKILDLMPDTKVVVSSVEPTVECAELCAISGAHGYIRCNATNQEWIDAIHGVVDDRVTDSRVAGLINTALRQRGAGRPKSDVAGFGMHGWRISDGVKNSAARVGLTPRERQVLALIDRGLSTKHIARELDMKPNTVKTHVSAILAKYNVHRRSEAAALFRKHQSEQDLAG